MQLSSPKLLRPGHSVGPNFLRSRKNVLPPARCTSERAVKESLLPHNRGAASPVPGGLGLRPACVLKLCRYEIHIIDSPWLYAP